MGNKQTTKQQRDGQDEQFADSKRGRRNKKRCRGSNFSNMSTSQSCSGGGWSSERVPADDKVVSCPNLASKRAQETSEQRAVVGLSGAGDCGLPSNGITIYRSYSNVARRDTSTGRHATSNKDIRNTLREVPNSSNVPGEQLPSAVDAPRDVTGSRAQTLPRSFGRSKTSAGSRDAASGRQTGRRGRLQRQSAFELNGDEWVDEPPPPPGRDQAAAGTMRDVRRTVSRGASMSASRYRVCEADLPDTAAIKRRTAQFSQQFSRDLVQLFTELTDTVQLNTLCVAVRADRDNQQISLWQYLNCPDIPADLHQNMDELDGLPPDYAITVPAALLPAIEAARRGPAADPATVPSLVRTLVSHLASDGAAELCRVFEYQLALLSDGLAVQLVAGHAARCVIDYVTCCGRHLDPNSVVLGVVRGRARPTTVDRTPPPTPILSVVVGERELKWQLSEIFKKPGLRKETLLFADDDVSRHGAGSESPWRFMTSPAHDHELYGYRGLILERDFLDADQFRLNDEDEAAFVDEVEPARPGDDFHQIYRPFRRLVGDGVLTAWSRSAARGKTSASENVKVDEVQMACEVKFKVDAARSLVDFVRQLHDEKFDRDEIALVQRTLAGLRPAAAADDDRSISPSNIDDDFLLRSVVVTGRCGVMEAGQKRDTDIQQDESGSSGIDVVGNSNRKKMTSNGNLSLNRLDSELERTSVLRGTGQQNGTRSKRRKTVSYSPESQVIEDKFLPDYGGGMEASRESDGHARRPRSPARIPAAGPVPALPLYVPTGRHHFLDRTVAATEVVSA